jgi:hypothetical protein
VVQGHRIALAVAWRGWALGDAYCPRLGGEIDVEQESPHVAPGQEARRVIDELGSSVWAFAAQVLGLVGQGL